MFKKIIILIQSLVLAFCCKVAPALVTPKFDNLTILVSSCDKYAIFWEPFFISLFKQWPSLNTQNKNIPILLVANTKQYKHPRVNTVNIPNETSWADNILTALEQVKTKYVLIALDDYWLNQPVNEKRLQELFLGMQADNAAMLQTSYNTLKFQNGPQHKFLKDVAYRDKFAHYKASLQMAIWETQALKDLLRPGEDPWTFELAGSIRSHGYPKIFLTITANEPIQYLNASHLGHITPEALEYIQQNQINFAAGNFPLLGKINWKMNYKIWRARLGKLVSFIAHPGLFYEFRPTV